MRARCPASIATRHFCTALRPEPPRPSRSSEIARRARRRACGGSTPQVHVTSHHLHAHVHVGCMASVRGLYPSSTPQAHVHAVIWHHQLGSNPAATSAVGFLHANPTGTCACTRACACTCCTPWASHMLTPQVRARAMCVASNPYPNPNPQVRAWAMCVLTYLPTYLLTYLGS